MSSRVPVHPPTVLSAEERATLQQWLVDAGDEVYAGERIAEIVVPGVLVSVTAPGPRRIEQIVRIAGAEVHPGDVLAWLTPADES